MRDRVCVWVDGTQGGVGHGDRQFSRATAHCPSTCGAARCRSRTHPRQCGGGPRPDESFDFAISEYGAAIWADPYRWIPEAHRLLRPGGTLVFLGNHAFVGVCSPIDGSYPISRRLERPYFGNNRLDWRDAVEDPGGIEFTLTFSKWIKLFRATGFEVLDLSEIQAPDDATGTRSGITAEWAREFPSEHVWTLRKGL